MSGAGGSENDPRAESPRTPMEGEHSESFLGRVIAFFSPSRTQRSVREETERLANFAVFFSLRKHSIQDSSMTETCMRRCITRMHEKHAMVFGGMMVRLNVSRNIDFYQGFLEVSEELFKEEINWSKIVALYAFGARLAQFCQENEMEDLLKEIASSLARFSNDHLLAYIQEQGGWETLEDVFPAENEIETQMMRSLGLLALVLASASAYLLFRRSS